MSNTHQAEIALAREIDVVITHTAPFVRIVSDTLTFGNTERLKLVEGQRIAMLREALSVLSSCTRLAEKFRMIPVSNCVCYRILNAVFKTMENEARDVDMVYTYNMIPRTQTCHTAEEEEEEADEPPKRRRRLTQSGSCMFVAK